MHEETYTEREIAMKVIYGCMFIILTLSSCANRQTIGRATTISKLIVGDSTVVVTANHLDVQQRLVLSDELNIICSERSPDVLTAYATSLGLGVAAPAQDSGFLV